MIIVTVDLWDGVASMLSIPRDLVVPIPGNGEDRINAAYVYGQMAHPDDPAAGPALAVETVSKQFKIPIEHYIQVDFNGFRGVVDAVGGVDISVSEVIDDDAYPTDDYGYKHIHFDPGCYHMNGEQALEYARTRHADSDDVRRDRQMQVMQAVLDRTADLNAARRLPDIITSLGTSVQTSIPWEGQLSLARMSRRDQRGGRDALFDRAAIGARDDYAVWCVGVHRRLARDRCARARGDRPETDRSRRTGRRGRRSTPMTSPTPPLRPVVVLGSINTDLVVRAPRFPRPGETMHGSDFAVVGGGKGANQATAAARLGAPVQFIGAVGADDFGARRIEEMREAGVDVAVDRAATGRADGCRADHRQCAAARTPSSSRRARTGG